MSRFNVYEEFDLEDGVDDYYQDNNENTMFDLSLGNFKSALVSAFVTAVLGMAGYVIGVGDVFNLNFHSLINIGVLSLLTAIVSLLKNFLTTDSGKFLNVVDTKA